MRNLNRTSVSHDESLVRELCDDPELAAEYLEAALADKEEPEVLLLALRHLAEAYGMSKARVGCGEKTLLDRNDILDAVYKTARDLHKTGLSEV